MDKARLLPMKVSDDVLDMMKTHLSGGKKDADLSELDFFLKGKNGGHELDPAVVSFPHSGVV